ncbi:sensor histidine kinase [Halorussus marinus]|uniref:sensor histidine kinase n=1 Tax=Halorussus marinus TaxID=2505976 RepID=UPI00106DE0B2|nr:histidine kinase N-terminal 7TM domain-containing protein [Halorussus marinus]
MAISNISGPLLVYALAFGTAAVACGVSVLRARKVEDPETRRGLTWLFATTGGWAAFQVGTLVAPTPDLMYLSYLLSLTVGLATVGGWLYFCSAYTDRMFHRKSAYRRGALAAYLSIVAVKATNPIHQLYFTTEVVDAPFTHLAVSHGTLHWIVSGLSYALVAVGFFMLLEMFLEVDYDTRGLGGVAALTGLPVVFDVVGAATPILLDINYEPIGVAVFAIGVLYLFEERFLAIQLTDGVDDAVVYLDTDGHIRDFNGSALEIFPELSDHREDPISTALPGISAVLGDEEPILECDSEDGTRYYLVSDTAFSLGQADIGQLVVFTDVTETERQRRDLDRQNEQLEGFAAAIRHELLNTLQIVAGQVSIASRSLDDGDVSAARESLRSASSAGDRMENIVEDLSALARHGQTVERTQWVDLDAAVSTAWNRVEAEDLSLSVDGEGEIEADAGRLAALLRNAFTFAAHNDADEVTVSLREDGFAVTDDGDPPGDATAEEFMEYGGAVPDSEAGMTLPNLKTIARVHGWNSTIDTDYTDGVRIVISDASVSQAAPQAA